MQTTLTATLVENQSNIIEKLDSVVVLHNKIQRNLYKDIVSYCIKNKVKSLPKEKVNELKSSYQIKYPINARQYNSIYAELMGKISSVLELNKESISELKDKIKSLEKAVKSKQKNLDLINKKLNGKDYVLTKIDQINLSNLKNKLFHLNNRLNKSNKKLKDLTQAQETNNPQLCFGSRKLFNQQFLIGTNNNLTEFKSHNDWKKAWIESRNKSFVLVGSSDETLGNQNCQINHVEQNIYELKVNLNPKDSKIANRYVNLQIKVHNDKNNLLLNILNNNLKQAITYRFYKDYKKNTYQIFISLDKSKQQPKCISNKQIGTIGTDNKEKNIIVINKEKTISNQLSKYYPFDLPVRNNQKQDNIYWKEIEQNYLKTKKHRLLSKKNKSLILDNIKLSCEITSVADSFEVYR